MEEMKCYKVLCVKGNKKYYVGIMTTHMAKAYKAAEKSLLEG